ncbi:MAG: neutral/alkaline non-lysosomal ceramidase N-terminal domain-containing protein [Verrucomicrobiales bacterium]
MGEPMAGYGERRWAKSEGVEETLFARALFLRAGETEVVLIAADVLLVHAEVARETVRLCAEQGIAEDGIYFTATHTHSGPGGWAPNVIEQAICGKFDEEAVGRLARVLASAVISARGAAEPSQWTWMKLSVPQFVRNRVTNGGVIDPSLDALAVRQNDDGATGVFAIYGAHATCFGASQMKFTADYPGGFVRHLEGGGIAFAAFGAGAVGSQSYLSSGVDAMSSAGAVGRGLAQPILESLRGAVWRNQVALATLRKDVPLPKIQVRLGQKAQLAPWLASTLHPQSAPLHLLRLDEHWLAGLPIEISAMLSAPLRAEALQRGVHLSITSFNGDYVGYVLPPEVFETGHYETTMSFLGPWGGEYFVDLIRAGTGLDEPAGKTE